MSQNVEWFRLKKFVFPPTPPYKLGSPQLGSRSRFRSRLWGGASALIFISLCGFSFRFARFVSTSRVPGVTYTLRGQGPGYAPCHVRFETRTHLPPGGCVVCHRADTGATGYLPDLKHGHICHRVVVLSATGRTQVPQGTCRTSGQGALLQLPVTGGGS